MSKVFTKTYFNHDFEEREKIYKIFGHRCIMCNHLASEINEIHPRGRSKDNIKDQKNRVPLCHSCHEKFHSGGVTEEKIKEMKEKRVEFLIAIGKEYLV